MLAGRKCLILCISIRSRVGWTKCSASKVLPRICRRLSAFQRFSTLGLLPNLSTFAQQEECNNISVDIDSTHSFGEPAVNLLYLQVVNTLCSSVPTDFMSPIETDNRDISTIFRTVIPRKLSRGGHLISQKRLSAPTQLHRVPNVILHFCEV